MLSLGDKLEQKISAVNTQLNVFREQQLVQQQQEQEARELVRLIIFYVFYVMLLLCTHV